MRFPSPQEAPTELSFERHGRNFRVEISAHGVVTHSAASEPSAFSFSLVEAFTGGSWRRSAPASVALDGHLRIAALLEGASPSPAEERRVRFLRHHDPTLLTVASYNYEVAGPLGSLRRYDLELTPHGLLGATRKPST